MKAHSPSTTCVYCSRLFHNQIVLRQIFHHTFQHTAIFERKKKHTYITIPLYMPLNNRHIHDFINKSEIIYIKLFCLIEELKKGLLRNHTIIRNHYWFVCIFLTYRVESNFTKVFINNLTPFQEKNKRWHCTFLS